MSLNTKFRIARAIGDVIVTSFLMRSFWSPVWAPSACPAALYPQETGDDLLGEIGAIGNLEVHATNARGGMVMSGINIGDGPGHRQVKIMLFYRQSISGFTLVFISADNNAETIFIAVINSADDACIILA
jgi:hypothetical protein